MSPKTSGAPARARADKKGAKGRKADGAPKQRWNAAERRDRGRPPRRSAGREFEDTAAAPRRFDARDDRRPAAERGDRPERTERRFDGDRTDDRGARPYRGRTEGRGDQRPFRRSDAAPDTAGRAFRPRWEDRGDRGPRDEPRFGDRDNRGFNRDDRGFNRDDRSGDRRFGNREDRGFNRDDRGFNRDDRGFNRDDRSGERRFGDRDDRGFNRDNRGFNRDDRSGERRFGNRDDRGFNRDDRPVRAREDHDRPFRREDRPFEDRRPERDGDRPFVRREDNDRPRRQFDDQGPRRPSGRSRQGDRAPWTRREERGYREPRPHRTPSADPDQMSWTAPEELEIEVVTSDTPVVVGGFADLGVPAGLVAALTAAGITQPFPIQAASIPDALAGRDVLGRGRTGSGKTLGFGLPLIANLAAGDKAAPGMAHAVILVPTRELALQVADVLAPLARTQKLTLALVAGGMSYGPQTTAFDRGVDIVVATPGRLIDLMDSGTADLTHVKAVVLDEADHMADLGFMPAVTQILDTVPAGGQRLLFSATLDNAVGTLVKRYLVNPVTHEVDPGQASVGTMEHLLLLVQPAEKAALTAELAGREGRTVVFVRTQRGADRVAEQLRDAGVLGGALHGGLTQGQRARMLAAFKDGRLPVLVATDVAARGIHVDDVGLVLQVDPPAGSKDYLHRAGRTARAGQTGVVVTLVLPHQRRSMTGLVREAGVRVHPQPVSLGDEQLAEATGARTPTGEPVSQQAFDALVAPPARPARGGPRGGRPHRGVRAGFSDRRRGR